LGRKLLKSPSQEKKNRKKGKGGRLSSPTVRRKNWKKEKTQPIAFSRPKESACYHCRRFVSVHQGKFQKSKKQLPQKLGENQKMLQAGPEGVMPGERKMRFAQARKKKGLLPEKENTLVMCAWTSDKKKERRSF